MNEESTATATKEEVTPSKPIMAQRMTDPMLPSLARMRLAKGDLIRFLGMEFEVKEIKSRGRLNLKLVATYDLPKE